MENNTDEKSNKMGYSDLLDHVTRLEEELKGSDLPGPAAEQIKTILTTLHNCLLKIQETCLDIQKRRTDVDNEVLKLTDLEAEASKTDEVTKIVKEALEENRTVENDYHMQEMNNIASLIRHKKEPEKCIPPKDTLIALEEKIARMVIPEKVLEQVKHIIAEQRIWMKMMRDSVTTDVNDEFIWFKNQMLSLKASLSADDTGTNRTVTSN